MPVATCSTNAIRVALPNTYHQPVRGGTGCSSACWEAVSSPLRSSSHARKRRSIGRSGDGNGAGQDLDLTVAHPDGILGQRPGRRTGGDGAVTIVDAAMTGAEEELRVGHPADRAAQVRAVHGERAEPLDVVATEPGSAPCGNPGP